MNHHNLWNKGIRVARSLSRSYANAERAELDDSEALSIAYQGVIDAIRYWQDGRGMKFESYCHLIVSQRLKRAYGDSLREKRVCESLFCDKNAHKLAENEPKTHEFDQIRAVLNAKRRLPKRIRAVVDGVSRGFQQVEIAEKMGVKKQRVHQIWVQGLDLITRNMSQVKNRGKKRKNVA